MSDVRTSERIPAAAPSIQAEKTDNGNTRIKLNVKHLAQPNRVVPGSATYVAWAKDSDTGNVQNLGRLQVESNLTAGITTTTSFPISIFL